MGVVFEREYGAATQLVVPLVKPDNNFAGNGDWTPVAGEVRVIKDGGFPSVIETLPDIVAGSQLWRFNLSASEMTAKEAVILVQSPGNLLDDAFVLTTYGHGLAQHGANRNIPLLAETDLHRAVGVLLSTTIESVVDATTVTLADGPAEDGYLADTNVVIADPVTPGLYAHTSVTSYTGATRMVAFATALPFTPALASAISFSAPGLCGQIGDMATTTGQDSVLQAIANINAVDAPALRAELLQILDGDRFSELTSVPPADATISEMLRWMYLLSRNRKQQGEQVQSVFANNNSTVIATRNASDVADTLTLTKFT